MLINLSNHPTEQWSDKQATTARLQFGELVDMPFPPISPSFSSNEVSDLANDYLQKCKKLLEKETPPNAVHLMGETVFCFLLGQLLLKAGIRRSIGNRTHCDRRKRQKNF